MISDFSTILLRFLGVLLALFMIVPLLVLVLFTFSESSLLKFPITGFTFAWFERLAEMREFWSSFRNSIIIAGTVGIISTIFGTIAAFGFMNFQQKSRTVGVGLITLPVMLPPLVMGISLLSFYSSIGLSLGLHTVIIGHLVVAQPFVILIVYARMATFDPSIVASARDLGASPPKAFFTVTLPIIRPTIIGAAMIAVALSLDDFVITFFIIGGENTLPTLLWGMLRKGVDPRMNVVALILISLTTCISILAMRLTRYRGQ